MLKEKKMNREIYPKVKLIISESMKEAKSFDDTKVRPEHIVLSMLNDDDNECVKILRKLKVDTTELHDKISDYLRKNDLTPRVTQTGRTKPPFSNETKQIFKMVDAECEKLNDKMIDTIHIMLAILGSKLPTTKILSELNVNYISFKNMIMQTRNDTPKNAFEDDPMNDDFGDERDELNNTLTSTGKIFHLDNVIAYKTHSN